MHTRTKVQALQVVEGIFGWVWIGASLVAIYSFGSALAFGGPWRRFFCAVGIGMVAKWLAVGTIDSRKRVAYEAALVNRGLPPDEAAHAWYAAYNGGRDRLAEMQRWDIVAKLSTDGAGPTTY